MTLKKGDKIRIKDEVSSETHYMVYPGFTKGMDELKGKVLTFSHTTPKGNIKTEEVRWVLHPDWVTLVESEPKDDFRSALKKGDKIRIKDEVSSDTHRKQFPHFVEEMDGLKDKVLTISDFTNRGYIRVEESGFNLHPEWVEPVKKLSFMDFPEVGSFEDFMGSISTGSIFGNSISTGSISCTPASEVASILEEAAEILEGERETDYGDPVANFTRIARIASSILNEDISPEQCVVIMMAVKLSREQYKHKRDNLVDLVAYTEILNRIKELNK